MLIFKHVVQYINDYFEFTMSALFVRVHDLYVCCLQYVKNQQKKVCVHDNSAVPC